MSDKDEITDLGEAVIAIIRDPDGTWVDSEGANWRWGARTLLVIGPRSGDWVTAGTEFLASRLPIRRIRYGWVPCEREEAFQLPDGCRVYMGRLWDPVKSTPLLSRLAMVEPWCTWVKWGRL